MFVYTMLSEKSRTSINYVENKMEAIFINKFFKEKTIFSKLAYKNKEIKYFIAILN